MHYKNTYDKIVTNLFQNNTEETTLDENNSTVLEETTVSGAVEAEAETVAETEVVETENKTPEAAPEMTETEAAETAPETQETPARKRKRDYHLMLFIDNEKGEIQQMGIGRLFIEIVAGIIAAILVVALVGWIANSAVKNKVKEENKTLATQVEELTAQVEELTAENSSLNDKITILSDTVNSKVEQENAQQKEVEEAHLPEGFPLSASASMKTDEEDANTILFSCSSGSNIISAGAGTIIEVIPDATYGNCVRIDHKNGYITEYYNSSTPLVREGDEVIEGSILYVVEDGSDTMAYRVSLDDKPIDPMDIIKIDG